MGPMLDDVIYLDHNATTPVDPAVLTAMLPYFSREFGNPSSATHVLGRRASGAVNRARHQLASLLNVAGDSIVFTSGATESNNWIASGLTATNGTAGRRRILVSALEHASALEPALALRTLGYEVDIVRATTEGCIDISHMRAVLDSDVALVIVQAVNNETGVIQPIRAVADLAHEVGALVHCDAAQALGKMPVDGLADSVDSVSLSGHKFYGPKGVGALVITDEVLRRRTRPYFFGGGQERGKRSGTLNVPGIVGIGEAARLVAERCAADVLHFRSLRDSLETALECQFPNVVLFGRAVGRVPNTTMFALPGVSADMVIARARRICLGRGSACSSSSNGPSHVLRAMGVDDRIGRSALRISFGRGSRQGDCDAVLELLRSAARSVGVAVS